VLQSRGLWVRSSRAGIPTSSSLPPRAPTATGEHNSPSTVVSCSQKPPETVLYSSQKLIAPTRPDSHITHAQHVYTITFVQAQKLWCDSNMQCRWVNLQYCTVLSCPVALQLLLLGRLPSHGGRKQGDDQDALERQSVREALQPQHPCEDEVKMRPTASQGCGPVTVTICQVFNKDNPSLVPFSPWTLFRSRL